MNDPTVIGTYIFAPEAAEAERQAEREFREYARRSGERVCFGRHTWMDESATACMGCGAQL